MSGTKRSLTSGRRLENSLARFHVHLRVEPQRHTFPFLTFSTSSLVFCYTKPLVNDGLHTATAPSLPDRHEKHQDQDDEPAYRSDTADIPISRLPSNTPGSPTSLSRLMQIGQSPPARSS
ncbi:hypothetical protein CERZMDRAFT_86841 [Cercospora zeae-maydis SCOH1-5]|uniref:Uncharacterized protein n=1 Tax=Cercospora zeae-maydis SCOH1-5 TaxID=717836 RepID=A0A6A6F6E4_9PEZI|nr:hypothetical protein CERZMDRAFT_86841 [Cercospora zeae-maydis SCOH1-5]